MMIPRERVLAALRHEKTDRTPFDFWAEPPAWRRFFEHLGHEDPERLLDELGIDILDPIQPASGDMRPERLKADYGGRLAFHGGIDMQNLLPNGTSEQVAAEARRYCEILGEGGGYILAPAHLFQPDVPPENILAVYSSQE